MFKTLSLTTFSIMAVSIKDLFMTVSNNTLDVMTLSIMGLFMTLSITVSNAKIMSGALLSVVFLLC